MNGFIAYSSLAKRAYDQAFEEMRARFGLSQSEADVLMFLFNNPECDTAREVEALRGLNKSVVSAALERLGRRGYVGRREDEQDRRVVHLTLTNAAREAAEMGLAAQRAFGERLLTGFSAAERTQLEAYFGRIRRNLSEGRKR